MLPYNVQLVVLTYKLICIVRAAHRQEEKHCETGLFHKIFSPSGQNTGKSAYEL